MSSVREPPGRSDHENSLGLGPEGALTILCFLAVVFHCDCGLPVFKDDAVVMRETGTSASSNAIA